MHPSLYENMYKIEGSHWWFRGRRKIVETAIRRYLDTSGLSILEAGCGTGGNLEMLSKFGKVAGMELNDHARELAKSRGVAEIFPGRLPDQLPFDICSTDLIVLLDVLEHIGPDVDSLVALGQLLKKNGWIIMTVPAFPFLWSYHDECHHHRRRYTRKSLQNVIAEAGMTVEYISYINSILFPVVALVRILQRLRGRKMHKEEIAVPPQPVNRLLEKLFGMEKVVIGRLRIPFGISLLAVIKK